MTLWQVPWRQGKGESELHGSRVRRVICSLFSGAMRLLITILSPSSQHFTHDLILASANFLYALPPGNDPTLKTCYTLMVWQMPEEEVRKWIDEQRSHLGFEPLSLQTLSLIVWAPLMIVPRAMDDRSILMVLLLTHDVSLGVSRATKNPVLVYKFCKLFDSFSEKFRQH